MDKILFYNYIKHLKDLRGPVYKEMRSFPKVAQVLLFLTGLSMVSGLACIIIEKFRPGFIFCFAAEIVICVVTFFYTENYTIVHSSSKFIEYREYCSDLFGWLKETFNMDSVEKVNELSKRAKNNLEKMEQAYKTSKERFDRWIQILVIPVILAVFTKLSFDQADMEEVINSVIGILLLAAYVIASLYVIHDTFIIFRKRKLEQMQEFSDDIQSIIDTQFEAGLFCTKETDNK